MKIIVSVQKKSLIKFLCIYLIFFIASLFTSVFAQENIKDYVYKNAVPIGSISPDSIDYTDLEPIGNAIGDSKIVMLGEQDHGDASTFLAKTRIIKYLHEKKGFNVLAFESDFFGLNYGWSLVKNGTIKIDTLIKKNIYAIWTYCNANNTLFTQYLPSALKTGTPLEITGFDNSMNTRYLFPLLDSELLSLKLPITELPGYSTQIFPLIRDWYKNTNDSIANKKVNSLLLDIKNQMLKKLSKDNFWIITIDNLIQLNIRFNGKKDYWNDKNIRDKQMALNLKWINEIKYPGEKIIVWAHNYHISKYNGHYPEEFLNNAHTMGSIFTTDSLVRQKTYIIGFTSYEGTAGRLFQKQYKIKRPGSNSFENWINKGYAYAFIDFKKFNLLNPNDHEMFYMSGSIKGNMLHTNHKAQWNKIFDGVFFIRKMDPCEKTE